MQLVEWDERLVLGMNPIDEHHEELVSILNRCYGALMLNDHQHELERIVTELRDYTRYHFGAEERLMADLGFPEAPDHAEAHRKFLLSIADFQARTNAGESFVAVDVLTFLKEWLVDHILKSDRSLARFVAGSGAR